MASNIYLKLTDVEITDGTSNTFVIDWSPTETTRPAESVGDAGFIINWFPTETTRLAESVGDAGFVINWSHTETTRPMESVFELLI